MADLDLDLALENRYSFPGLMFVSVETAESKATLVMFLIDSRYISANVALRSFCSRRALLRTFI